MLKKVQFNFKICSHSMEQLIAWIIDFGVIKFVHYFFIKR